MNTEQFLTTAEKVANRVNTVEQTTQQYVSQVMDYNVQIKESEPNLNLFGKVNLFLNKEIIPNTGIKWLHVALVAGAYFVYVQFMADARTKRKLKFW